MSDELFVSRGFVGKRRGREKKRIASHRVNISRMIFLSFQQAQPPTPLSTNGRSQLRA